MKNEHLVCLFVCFGAGAVLLSAVFISNLQSLAALGDSEF